MLQGMLLWDSGSHSRVAAYFGCLRALGVVAILMAVTYKQNTLVLINSIAGTLMEAWTSALSANRDP